MKKKGITFKRIAISVFIIYASITLVNQQMSISKLHKAEQEAIAKTQKVNQDNERLKKMINNATSPEYVEKMAREQLGLVKVGERVYIDQTADQKAVGAPSKDIERQSE